MTNSSPARSAETGFGRTFLTIPEKGVYLVTTKHSSYVVDMTAKIATRFPGEEALSVPRGDCEPIAFTHLQAEIGYPLGLVDTATGYWLRSTAVREIREVLPTYPEPVAVGQ